MKREDLVHANVHATGPSPAPSILIVGAGGLGCPAAVALARAGVTRLTLMDADTVDPTNLHRQLLHRVDRIGQPKVESARQTLQASFPQLRVSTLEQRLDATNGQDLFAHHDVVIDGTDGLSTKVLLSDLAVQAGRPLVHGGVLRLSGLAFVIRPGGPCLRCLFPEPPDEDATPTCAQAGVLGTVAGVVGALQARLALEALARGRDGWDSLGHAEEIHHFDALRLSSRRARLAVDPACGCAAVARSREGVQESRAVAMRGRS